MALQALERSVPETLPASDRRALRRAGLWAILAAKIVAAWGVRWDVQWHILIGRDSFWIAPHLMTYGGVSAILLVSVGLLLWETGRPVPGTRRCLGLRGTRGFHLTAGGVAITVAAAPLDDLWHRLFGLDVTLWSPPHLLGFLGGAVSSLGCLVVAGEVYPAGSRARVAALALGGAALYGTLRMVLEPAYLVAYRHGGIRFHAFAVLAALALQLALVTATRLAGLRWTPLLVMGVVVLSTLGGEAVARLGFALLQPVSVIGPAIGADPTSPITLAHEIARKNGTPPGRVAGAGDLLGALLPAAALALVDPRRRPIAATVVYAAVLFGVTADGLARAPAFRPLVPTVGESAVAIALTLAAAVLGALAAHRLARVLGAAEAAPR